MVKDQGSCHTGVLYIIEIITNHTNTGAGSGQTPWQIAKSFRTLKLPLKFIKFIKQYSKSVLRKEQLSHAHVSHWI